jgi:hypothetical protein
MSRPIGSFVPMAGTARTVFDVLAELLDTEAECTHKHPKKCQDEDCRDPTHAVNVTLLGLEEAAVRLSEMIEKGELA